MIMKESLRRLGLSGLKGLCQRAIQELVQTRVVQAIFALGQENILLVFLQTSQCCLEKVVNHDHPSAVENGLIDWAVLSQFQEPGQHELPGFGHALSTGSENFCPARVSCWTYLSSLSTLTRGQGNKPFNPKTEHEPLCTMHGIGIWHKIQQQRGSTKTTTGSTCEINIQKQITLLRVIPTMTCQDVYLNIYFIYAHILSDIYSNILSGILSDIYSDIPPGILSGTLSDIYSGILSDIHSGILSGILFGIHSDILSGRGYSRLRSGREHSAWILAVEVWQGTLGVDGRG